MKRKEFIGKKCFDELFSLFKEFNFLKVFIVTGKNSYEKTGAKIKLEKILENKKTKFYFKTKEYTDLLDVQKCIVELKKFSPDVILALGGGSVIDLAKIVNCLYFEENFIEQIKNETLFIKKKYVKLIAIPTTAGSGAEVTSNAVLYINKVKYSIEGIQILPDYSFIDPELVMSLPKPLSAAAGLDALSQAIESILSVKASNDSIKFAQKSLSYSIDNIENHINKQTFLTAYNMCNASFFAGKAINISKTTAPHAVSYPLTSYWGVPHGHAVSLTLNDFLKYNYINKKNSKKNVDLIERYELLFNIFKCSNIKSLNLKINNILNSINLETNLKKLNVTSSQDVEKIVSNVNEQRLNNNPVPVTKEIIKNILLSKIR